MSPDPTRAAVTVERRLLGGLMLYPDEVHEVSDLEPSDFLRPQHARLFALFREWAGLGERWDVGRIGDMLDRGTLPAGDYGGAADLLSMPRDAVLPEQVVDHAQQVRIYALRRRAHLLCAEGQEQVRTTESPMEYIERLSDRIGELVMSRKDQVRQTTAHEEAPKLLARIAERAQSQTRGFGLTTGIDELDAMLLGLHPGKLYLIAGRPGMGKSVLGRMVTLAATQPGFLGVDSARDAEGFGLTVSYWVDEASALAWRRNLEHAEARRQGRERFYEAYTLRVATVHRASSFERP